MLELQGNKMRKKVGNINIYQQPRDAIQGQWIVEKSESNSKSWRETLGCKIIICKLYEHVDLRKG